MGGAPRGGRAAPSATGLPGWDALVGAPADGDGAGGGDGGVTRCGRPPVRLPPPRRDHCGARGVRQRPAPVGVAAMATRRPTPSVTRPTPGRPRPPPCECPTNLLAVDGTSVLSLPPRFAAANNRGGGVGTRGGTRPAGCRSPLPRAVNAAGRGGVRGAGASRRRRTRRPAAGWLRSSAARQRSNHARWRRAGPVSGRCDGRGRRGMRRSRSRRPYRLAASTDQHLAVQARARISVVIAHCVPPPPAPSTRSLASLPQTLRGFPRLPHYAFHHELPGGRHL